MMPSSALKKLLENVDRAIGRHSLLRRKDALVVGVSGGPDSTALLSVLVCLRRKYALRLVAAHLDHGLDRKASRRYRLAVERLCRRLDVPLFCRSVDVRKVAAAEKRSLEESGRTARYAFFAELAVEKHCGKIATAHTLDDQAETMLLRLLRGTGLRGLTGIPCSRPLGRLTVIRPFLACPKSDILAYLKAARLPFAVDKTNRQTLFTRNRVRHHLLPVLARYNPQIKALLASLQAVCVEAQDYISRAAHKTYRRHALRKKDAVCLSLKAVRKLHPAVRREVLLLAVAERKGNLKKIAHEHVAQISAMLFSAEVGLERSLPGGVYVRNTSAYLEFR